MQKAINNKMIMSDLGILLVLSLVVVILSWGLILA